MRTLVRSGVGCGIRFAALPFIAAIGLLLPPGIEAQAAPSSATAVMASATATGRIVGQILDARTGRPLSGAQVVIDQAGTGVLAGLDGRYLLQRVPAGVHDLRVMMIGYATKTVTEVQVPADAAIELDVTLEPSAVAIEGITVTSTRESGSVASALNEQRVSRAVVNAIGAEQISRSPDGDAADAVRRVSGVTIQDGKNVFVRGLGERYTTSSLNGARIPSPDPERKTVPFDLFPSGVIQSISTSKTFTPDQPGDFSGGSVNIRTREFPTERQLTFSLSSGWHAEVTGKSILAAPTEGGEWYAHSTASREIPGPALAFEQEASRGPVANGIVNAFRNRWSAEHRNGALPLSLGVSLGGSDPIFGTRIGYLASATYSHSTDGSFDQQRARFIGDGVESDRYDGSTGRNSVLMGGLLNLSALLGPDTRISLNNSYNRSADNEARSEEGVDENSASRVRIERLRYVERVVRSNQFRLDHQFSPAHRIDLSVTSSGVTNTEPDRSEFVTWLDPEVPIWFNDSQGAVRTFGEVEENVLEAAADWRWTLGSGLKTHELRFGGTWRSTDRDAASLGYRIKSFHWSPTDPRWQESPEVFFDGRNAGAEDANFLLSRDLAGGTYDASDDLVAGFAMAELALTERLQLIGGARIERYELGVNAENNLGQPFSVRKEYTDILPALTLNYDLTSRQKLRVSLSRTLARPEYRELAPIAYREVLGGEQVSGNQNLERTLIDNADLRWEHYPSPTEIFSIGLFAKRFDRPIEQRYLGTSGTDILTFENAVSGFNLGVELEAATGLGFLSPSLRDLSVFSNATFMKSEVETADTSEEKRRMVGQAPWVANAGITYSAPDGAHSATLLFNAVGERIVNARPSGRDIPDVIEQPRPTLDLSVRFPLVGGASAKVDLKNLLDAPHEVLQGDVVREYHRSGRTASFGVSWRM